MSAQKLKISAPAKINLFLHVTGKRDDGYHLLESLVGFTDVADEITISPSSKFQVSFDGPFSELLDKHDNLIISAAEIIAEYAGKSLDMIDLHLTKNIPLGAGLGGGSADAAATVRGLIDYWNLEIKENDLQALLLKLGADVPVCYAGSSSIMRGIGEDIQEIEIPNNIPVLLIHPGASNSTVQIFKNYNKKFSQEIKITQNDFLDKDAVTSFLQKQENDLTDSAIETTPIIQNILGILSEQKGCALSRMSGSGSCCFGVFDTIEQAKNAKKNIAHHYPDWWVEESFINKI